MMHFRKISRDHPKLKKCGYEKQLCLLNKTEYTIKLLGLVKTLAINTNRSFYTVVDIEPLNPETVDFIETCLIDDEKVNHFLSFYY